MTSTVMEMPIPSHLLEMLTWVSVNLDQLDDTRGRLIDSRDGLIAVARAQGATLTEIGHAVGLSHVAVRNILIKQGDNVPQLDDIYLPIEPPEPPDPGV